jgi:hypothetical protein
MDRVLSMSDDDFVFRPEVEFVCPCGVKAAAGYGDFPNGAKNVPTAIHELPYCEKFEMLDPDVYVNYVYRHLKQQKPPVVN